MAHLTAHNVYIPEQLADLVTHKVISDSCLYHPLFIIISFVCLIHLNDKSLYG
jgi:hypothetical protein